VNAERVQLEMLAALRRGMGLDRAPIAACSSDYEFIKRYGLTMEGGLAFDFEKYKHMIEVYEDDHPDQVLMAGAQTSKSVRLMVRLLRAGVQHWGSMFGYYFPDMHLPKAFSTTRFTPFIRSSPELGKWLGRNAQEEKGNNNVLTRIFGASTFFFLSVGGKSMTEGLPMKGVFFDEVRKMAYGDVQRAEERTSAQTGAINFKVSTARYPNSDIHAAFMKGDQRYFHTNCSCPEGVVLSLTFPNCVADLSRATPEFRRKVEHAFRGGPWLGMTPQDLQKYGEACYVCPKCGDIISDPRHGWWEPHAPGKWIHSYQFPQMLTPTFSASRVWQKYDRPDEKYDIQELWNSMLGLPYIDAANQFCLPEHLQICVNSEARWTMKMTDKWRRENVKNTAMGIDAMGGFNIVVIKQMAPNGKYRTIHVEVCHGEDPWKRCAALMQLFDVQICVADCNPHWNEAHRFAKVFEGRVWLSVYHDGGPGAEMVSWKDRKKSPAGQIYAGEDVKFKYMVLISRYKGLQWSLKRWARRQNEVPDPKGLIQRLPVQAGKVVLTAGLRVGGFEPVPICEQVYFHHMTCVVARKDFSNPENERQNIFRMVAEHVGLDPHFAHANLYADVALARIGHDSIVEGGS
jgi:Phage terminase large subunit (GpA)